jgi:hypothetical protein
MNIEISKPTYEVGETRVRFLEITAMRQGNSWEYFETGPWFKKQAIGLLYEKFLEKVKLLKEKGLLLELECILCNAAYATELYIHQIITPQMIHSIEEKVGGAGREMAPIITIPKQEILLSEVSLPEVRICIVDCFSYNGFCFIDKHDKDM